MEQGHTTKGWDWQKNTDTRWLVPSLESAWLAERWHAKAYSSVLDLGCGLGRHAIYLARRGFAVTAADLSPYAVDHLRGWAEREQVGIDTVVCNMLSLPFKTSQFDAVLAYNVIYHTDTIGFRASLAAIRRVLKPGGELFLTLISKNTWGFTHADPARRLDEQTILRDEHETERDVPHFYVDLADIRQFFADWQMAVEPREWVEYKMDQPTYRSVHWVLCLIRPDDEEAQP